MIFALVTGLALLVGSLFLGLAAWAFVRAWRLRHAPAKGWIDPVLDAYFTGLLFTGVAAVFFWTAYVTQPSAWGVR